MGDQTEPVHRHEGAVDAGKGQPEMKFAERLVQAAAKKFGKPEKQRGKNCKGRGDTHHEMEMGGDEIVADSGSGGEVVGWGGKAGEATREEKRKRNQREKQWRG